MPTAPDPQYSKGRGHLFKTVLIFLLLTGITLALAEMSLQIFHMTQLVTSDPDQFIFKERLRNVSVPRKVDDTVLGHRPNPKFFEHDLLGFRNAEVPEQVDIVAIGDSQTYGTNVHRPEAWPQQLAAVSEHSVYNMAFGGYSPLHHLQLFEEALQLKPRLVISAVYFGNDFLETFMMGYRKPYETQFASTDPSLRKLVIQMQKTNPVTASVDKYSEPEYSFPYSPPTLLHWLSRRFHLVQQGIRFKNWLSGKTRDPKLCLENFASTPMPPDSAAPTVLMSRYRWITVNNDDPRVKEGLRISLAALREMSIRAKNSKVSFMVVLIPTKERVYKEIIKAQGATAIFNQLMQDEERLEKRLIQFFENENISYLRLLPALKLSLWSGQSPYPDNADGHPAPVGHQAIAQCLSVYLKQTGKLSDTK